MYQGSVVACAMFLTGQASNVLGAALALKLVNVKVTWTGWFVAAIVPGLVSCALVPWIVYRVLPPEIKHTPEASAFAAREIANMGRLTREQWTVLAVFLAVGLLWVSSAWHGLEVAFVALLGLCALLLSGALKWADCLGEKSAWDMFVWYGGLLRMGELLNATGVTKAFAEGVGGLLAGIPWLPVLIAILFIYFYCHYLFASITTHLLAMFPPFVVLVVGLGAPPLLAVFSLLCLANLTAGLTHYGTTSAPILFSTGYVPLRDWWRAGFVVSLANLAVWLTVGFAWWKVLGFW
jgi:DASS family divalent anion:Na+ symporter